ncbi:MAG TPA: hypothetical protein P5523_08435, partial [Bacteroidales bacterium]|nr:hypothetical protein [Bacteroidales bacterium]
MAFKDIFDEQRKKLQNYFGVGKPGLGTFGQQASNVLKPIVNKNIQNYQKAGRYLQPQNVVKRNVQNYQQVARPVQQFAQRQIQRPIIQATLHPIQTLKRGYQSQPRMEEMPAFQEMFGVSPYPQLQGEDKLYNKITNWRPKNKTLRSATNFILGSPEENQKIREAFKAINRGQATEEQRKIARSGIENKFLWGIGGGTKSVNTIDQAAKTIAKSKSAVVIGDVLKKTLGIESNKVGKSLIKDLISESDPKKVKNIVNLLKPASQKAQTIIPKATDALKNEARNNNVSIFGNKINEEKIASQKADFQKMRDYQFKYKVGDKVKTSNGNEIISDMYIQDGQPRYTTYPAGKKNSHGYYTWSHEKDLQPVTKNVTVKSNNPYTKENVEQLLDANPQNDQINKLYYSLRDYNGDVSDVLSPKEKNLIDKFSSQPLSPQSTQGA